VASSGVSQSGGESAAELAASESDSESELESGMLPARGRVEVTGTGDTARARAGQADCCNLVRNYDSDSSDEKHTAKSCKSMLYVRGGGCGREDLER
jgi:hypothetical protein